MRRIAEESADEPVVKWCIEGAAELVRARPEGLGWGDEDGEAAEEEEVPDGEISEMNLDAEGEDEAEDEEEDEDSGYRSLGSQDEDEDGEDEDESEEENQETTTTMASPTTNATIVKVEEESKEAESEEWHSRYFDDELFDFSAYPEFADWEWEGIDVDVARSVVSCVFDY